MRPRLYCQRVLNDCKVKMDYTMMVVALMILAPLFRISCRISALKGSRSYQHPSKEAIQGSYMTLFPNKISSFILR